MYFVRVHVRIVQIANFFNRIGLRHSGNKATVKDTILKLFYSIYYPLFLVSILGGIVTSDKSDELIFLIEAAIIVAVRLTNLSYIIWRKSETVELLQQICVYPVPDQRQFIKINHKLNKIMKFNTVFWAVCVVAMINVVAVTPFVGNERKLFLSIAFPLDWKNDATAYWIAFSFFSTEECITIITLQFLVIKWYLMLNCAIKYEILGNQLRNMGASASDLSQMEQQNLFRRDLIAGIRSYKEINMYEP